MAGATQQYSAFEKVAKKSHLSYLKLHRLVPRVRRWLSQCVNEHRGCPGSQSRPLPARILDVGRGEQDLVKLMVTSGESATYACLSHC